MSQLEVAEAAGITRQSLYAIEQGKAQPSVGVAMRIARKLGTTVEDLFDEENPIVEAHAASGSVVIGARVVLGWSGDRRIALSLDPRSSVDAHRAGDGVVRRRRGSRVDVELLSGREIPSQTLLVAGCAPALSVIAQRLSGPASRIVSLQVSSVPALQLLRANHVQVAGIHFVSDAQTSQNGESVGEHLPRRHVLLFNLAVWEQGFVVAKGNPKGIRDDADLLRGDVRVVQRDAGAAAQLLLDATLRRVGSTVAALSPGAMVADGHLDVARLVISGVADVGIATRAAANAYGAGFVPLTEERFDLAVPADVAESDVASRFLEALRRSPVRRELDSLGGYGTTRTGELVAELAPR